MISNEELKLALIVITRYLVNQKGFTTEDAEDLAVETVLKSHKAFDETRGVPFLKWTFKQLHWTIIDYYRKKQDTPVDNIEHYTNITVQNNNIELLDDYKKSKELVLKAFEALDEEARKYFLLTVFESKERCEIIEILKLSQNEATAIYKRMKSGLKKIVKEMGITIEDINLSYFNTGGIPNEK